MASYTGTRITTVLTAFWRWIINSHCDHFHRILTSSWWWRISAIRSLSSLSLRISECSSSHLLWQCTTRLTYNCAHLRSTKESLTDSVKKNFCAKICLCENFFGWKFVGWTFFEWTFFLGEHFLGENFFEWKFWVKFLWVIFFWVNIFLSENFWVKIFWVKFFLGENFFLNFFVEIFLSDFFFNFLF